MLAENIISRLYLVCHGMRGEGIGQDPRMGITYGRIFVDRKDGSGARSCNPLISRWQNAYLVALPSALSYCYRITFVGYCHHSTHGSCHSTFCSSKTFLLPDMLA